MTRRIVAAGWLRRRRPPPRAPEPAQVVTTLRPDGWRQPGAAEPGVTWLKARDVPLPGHPPDPVVFGPPRVRGNDQEK